MLDIEARVADGKLHGFGPEHFCAMAEWRMYLLRRWIGQRKRARFTTRLDRILSDPNPPICYDSEAVFSELQHEHTPPAPYGYDAYSTWRRASRRSQWILNLPEHRVPGKRALEIAAGDGMTARLLADYGHDVTLCDIEDWRDDRARSLPFVECDICDRAPLEDDSFDLVYSYNAFEHLVNPLLAFREMERLCRPQGLLFLSFGPLYCSPWGLHAYRALNMPYPQFLFTGTFVEHKIARFGIYDLGRHMTSLQPLNAWRIGQFAEIWHGGTNKVLSEHKKEDWSCIDMTLHYPGAFRGRGLTVADLVTQGVSVLIRKTEE